MKNKNVGFLVVGISIVIGIIIIIFNLGLRDIVSQTCIHGESCSMYNTISLQTWISLSIALLVFFIGIFLIFSKPEEKIVVKKVKTKLKKKKINLKELDKKEKQVIKILQKENGAIFQKTLMERLEIGKVGMTRLLDKLEAKQLIERKRRGMNNIVVLKNNQTK
jgi:uncharacterized membrane protein